MVDQILKNYQGYQKSQAPSQFENLKQHNQKEV